MAVNKMLITLAFAMGFAICVQGLKISRDKKDYDFGEPQDGDIDLLTDQPATADRELDHHHITPTFVVKPADDKMRKTLGDKDAGYVPKIHEIIVKDQGGGSKNCVIENGGIGKSHVTLKFTSHMGGKLNYLVTLRGQ